MEIYYAKSPEDALRRMTDKLIKIMQSKPGLVPFNLALSGGSTAPVSYTHLAYLRLVL